MKKYKYSELSEKAKITATLDYMYGWNDNHEAVDHINLKEAFWLIGDTEDDILYDEKGNMVD